MHELVKDYYDKQLSGSADLKTTARCDASSMPGWLKPLLARIHPKVLERYYGRGLVCPRRRWQAAACSIRAAVLAAMCMRWRSSSGPRARWSA